MIYTGANFKKGIFIMGKHFDQEYKDYVSRLTVEENGVIKEVSYKLDITYGTLRR